MIDRSGRDTTWNALDENGKAPTWERVNTAILMDIRRELRTLNCLLNCSNFRNVPRSLTTIARNTAPRKKR